MRWVSLLSLLVAGAAVAQTPYLPDFPDACAHARAAAARLALEQAWGPYGPWGPDSRSADTDVLHYFLDIELNPTTTWIGGSNTMTVRSRVNNLTEFRFRLADEFTLSAVQMGGVAVAWVRLDPETVKVTLDRPYNLDEVFELYVAYDGQPLSGGSWGSITFRMRNGAPEVFTLSQPWFAYTWWPAKDDLEDKTTADLWFTVPEVMVAASNGTQQGIDNLGNGKLRYRWKTEYQTEDYLYCLGATNYHTFDATWLYPGGSMPLNFFIYPESDTPSNRNKWLECLTMLDVYSERYGLYPFVNEKYGMLQFGWGGGMEHQTITSIGGFWDWIVAHEASHMWWGDMVTCATWHDIWLNEGFATYSEAIWAEYKPGSPGTPALLNWMANRRPNSVNGSVYCYDITNMNRIFSGDFSYRKGAWVLHMLRHVVGDQSFFDILAAWRAAYQYGSATTVDFQAIAEGVTGRALTWFFQPWVYDIGAPAYQYAWQVHSVNGRAFVEVYVKQVQSASYPLFPMPVDIVTTIGSTQETHVVWNDAPAEHLLFEVAGAAVANLAFDPQEWILWTSRTGTTFVEGPPKLVSLDPPPGGELGPGGPAAIEIGFHKDVVANAGHFALAGAQSGPVACTFSYSGPSFTATLVPGAPLAPDTYTLTVSDQITAVAGGKALDGELADPSAATSLPSGDGLPGGVATATFRVYASLQAGDLNCDGTLNAFDIDPFVIALTDPVTYAVQYPDCRRMNADINGDGAINSLDIDPFVLLLTGP